MTAVADKELVLVEFEFEYTTRDGRLVSIKPNERYTLVSKTNDDWWHVRKDEQTKPFYIPAKYVKELPVNFPSPLDIIWPDDLPIPEPFMDKCSADLLTEKQDDVTHRFRSSWGNDKKPEVRMSTFGAPQGLQDLQCYELVDSGHKQQTHLSSITEPRLSSKNISPHMKRSNMAQSTFSPADSSIRTAPPVIKNTKLRRSVELPELPEISGLGPQMDSTPDSDNIYETIPEIQGANPKATITGMNSEPILVPPAVPLPRMAWSPPASSTLLQPPPSAIQVK
ncbi:hypothetical protein GJAV_G00151280 [Gymnothorax javanicus]|nr:hypothetical protein GJAV_G00151280 [Gymnothorax javanicus]